MAPQRVSGRVVKISSSSICSVRKTTDAPSERPIQFVCKVRTLLWPVQLREIHQLIGIICGAKEPLFQVFFDNWCTAALAMSVIAPDLLTCQGGVAVRTPVNRRKFSICQVMFIELERKTIGTSGNTLDRRILLRAANRTSRPCVFNWARIRSIFAYVHTLGWIPRLIAAFSAGRPKASKPIGKRTL